MIHQYKLSGYNIVLDVYSGSVHAVDDVAYDAIALIDQAVDPQQAATAQLEQKVRVTAPTSPPPTSAMCFDDIEELTAAGPAVCARRLRRPRVRLQEPLQRRQGAVPARGPHLQPELQLLLRRAGQVPRRGRPDEL